MREYIWRASAWRRRATARRRDGGVSPTRADRAVRSLSHAHLGKLFRQALRVL